ncbi:fimbrial chaperone [Salmonella enterica]|uniref:Fimbrial chaperone n=3 Tax=Salmonella enterica TaxID=28901 RepID=A0A5U4SFS2_SALER|nr:fimbrial chaperone [Salmonella enterica]EAA3086068.1 fimbrial chaperone [Salmonella enterica subsp. enterica serovar Telelkebir]EAB8290741.1 fimbrial chaperone [Salmonella enterica subsp. enterica serovar Bracknell]EBF8345623.1 fimbrial chaperone [Salmonella enterica subsp. enterica serovar Nagoya]EBV2942760.1 fimbrial chaperone [Salmonella enterica subsp. enterica serovar Woodhull]EBV4708174.1 fimbrial chaperone [Salmonella enterica subsp. enterica serovar Durham]EBX1545449.1 fimbrial cha
MVNMVITKGFKATCFAAAAFAAFTTFQVNADIVISGTRIVYPQSSKDVIVNLDNRGNKPLLVQTWLDDGRDGVNPQELKLPFVITPPVSRIDPQKGQSLRITYMGSALPQDRESLFWFNVLEIPPKSKAKEGESLNQLQLAFRTRIKLFFRPDGLKGTPGDAATNLKWSQKKEGNTLSLFAQNDSPYNVSVSNVKLKVGSKEYTVDSKSVLPFSGVSMPVKGLSNNISGTVIYNTINDNGGTDKREAKID